MANMGDVVKYTKKLKLLYVEDNEDVRKTTSTMFEILFAKVITAVDGADGFDKFIENEQSIDIVMSDINMPRLNGLEMTAKIREKNQNIPIILLSAYNQSDFTKESEKLSVDGYIFKPIEIKQFLETLERVVLENIK